MHTGSARRIFNYRLSRARRISENVFRNLSARFRVLRKPLLLEPEKVKKIIKILANLYLVTGEETQEATVRFIVCKM
ncbi:unnamed protein product [Acanthoscelides obtectus]|uniref:DDE Tnp4 domain-containing protein n=1 Tax=Acanthoscelides obtectus TaxID=200917 RepID=A0A9P0KUF5_ACAOB|nr:unnamed protein product [Acanthoscelides obtectus]CAK1682108.1 hypothetical protein AOBTE_LOCUS33429 [Acanthoscelides obtectus]